MRDWFEWRCTADRRDAVVSDADDEIDIADENQESGISIDFS